MMKFPVGAAFDDAFRESITFAQPGLSVTFFKMHVNGRDIHAINGREVSAVEYEAELTILRTQARPTTTNRRRKPRTL